VEFSQHGITHVLPALWRYRASKGNEECCWLGIQSSNVHDGDERGDVFNNNNNDDDDDEEEEEDGDDDDDVVVVVFVCLNKV
jgi:hypothetical protein